MFDGVPVDQHFHRFISSSTSSSLTTQTVVPPPTNINHFLLSSFDDLLFPPPPPPHQTHQLILQSNDHLIHVPPRRHQYMLNSTTTHDQAKVLADDDHLAAAAGGGDDIHHHSWSNDEVIELFRMIKSSTSEENWHPLTSSNWDHVSRKLAELGYRRSAEECKDKFEEETLISSSTIGYNKSSSSSSRYLISEEVEHDQLCNNNSDTIGSSPHENINVSNIHDQEHDQVEEKGGGEQNLIKSPGQKEKDPPQIMAPQDDDDDDTNYKNKKRKRKRKHEYKMVKGLCVELVNKMMTQQEEMHKKLLQDMARRDEEKREEAWRKQEEMERVQMEIHSSWEHEQEMARDRQSTITQFLNKLTSCFDIKKIQIPAAAFGMSFLQLLEDNIDKQQQPLSANNNITAKTIPPASSTENQYHPNQLQDDDGDNKAGKRRWPRDEVLALINIRRSINNNNNNNGSSEEEYYYKKKGASCSTRSSLWERISQGMLELGYKRSAKRCKEKWENINKYFRKTNNNNNNKKIRSLDSTTCPYYHELTKLYNHHQHLTNSTSAQDRAHHA